MKVAGSKNELHNNFQDYQAFSQRGRIGSARPLLYAPCAQSVSGSVELCPCSWSNRPGGGDQGYVGLATQDTSGPEFKYGIAGAARPPRIWQEPLPR